MVLCPSTLSWERPNPIVLVEINGWLFESNRCSSSMLACFTYLMLLLLQFSIWGKLTGSNWNEGGSERPILTGSLMKQKSGQIKSLYGGHKSCIPVLHTHSTALPQHRRMPGTNKYAGSVYHWSLTFSFKSMMFYYLYICLNSVPTGQADWFINFSFPSFF